MSTAKAVRAAIGKLPRGKPFTAARLLRHGTRGAVDRTLSRLVGEGAIQRLAHGVFVRPRTSRFVGTVLPDIHEVVEAIARSNGEGVVSEQARWSLCRSGQPARVQEHERL